MSLYIKPENQTYLWNTIHSHPKFQPYLRQYPPEKISGWFRSTIEGFYRKWGEKRSMNEQELKQLNQNTVAYLYQSIASVPSSSPISTTPQPPPQQQQQQQQQQQATIQQQFQQHPSLPKPLPEFHGQHEFEQRAQEYQSMNSKPATAPLQGKTDADQRESQEAMERKWMEQQRLREKDMEHFSPPSQVNGGQAINLNLLKSTTSNETPISTEKETESIQLKIREINDSKGNETLERPITTTTIIQQNKTETEIEPNWMKRLENMEQLQEKMSKQMEQILQHLFSKAPESISTREENKMGEIDE